MTPDDSGTTAGSIQEHVPTQGTPFVPLNSRARWAVAGLVVTGVADVVAIVLDRSRIDLLDRIGKGDDVTLSAAAASDHRQVVLAVVQVCLIALTAFVFIRWFRRAYLNVDALGAERRFGVGWSIGGWFVPVLSVWRPKQIANDLWHTSDPGDPTERSATGRSSPLLTLWWLVFLVSTWVSTRAGLSGGDSTHALRRSTLLDLVADSIDVVAAALAVVVVLKLTERQAQRARRRTEVV